VTFDPVPLYIICLRLGPSIPGVYVNPGFWTPKIRVLQRFKNRICVLEIDSLRETILKEAHDSNYSIHPGSTKMYQDLKQK
jgi:hypothetical protein